MTWEEGDVHTWRPSFWSWWMPWFAVEDEWVDLNRGGGNSVLRSLRMEGISGEKDMYILSVSKGGAKFFSVQDGGRAGRWRTNLWRRDSDVGG